MVADYIYTLYFLQCKGASLAQLSCFRGLLGPDSAEWLFKKHSFMATLARTSLTALRISLCGHSKLTKNLNASLPASKHSSEDVIANLYNFCFLLQVWQLAIGIVLPQFLRLCLRFRRHACACSYPSFCDRKSTAGLRCSLCTC